MQTLPSFTIVISRLYHNAVFAVAILGLTGSFFSLDFRTQISYSEVLIGASSTPTSSSIRIFSIPMEGAYRLNFATSVAGLIQIP